MKETKNEKNDEGMIVIIAKVTIVIVSKSTNNNY